MEKIKPCEMCGEMMTYHKSNKRYCTKCYRAMNNKRQSEKEKLKRQLEKGITSKEPDRTLTRIAIEAREHGMSYGRYMACRVGGQG